MVFDKITLGETSGGMNLYNLCETIQQHYLSMLNQNDDRRENHGMKAHIPSLSESVTSKESQNLLITDVKDETWLTFYLGSVNRGP